ncbi:MAG TPA: response regulator [Candidatus Acidoferrales bacterium]
MPRILVADDNTNIQKMVVLAFQERGIEVITVGNGEAAVRRIPDANPDLVLADVFMPVRNGYEVCEFVKKDTRFSHIPVILLVGAFDPLDEKEARRVGADGVLKKPFVPPDPLIAMVMSALEKNPRVIAELAKAKEAKEAVAAAASLPAVVMESPMTAEVKPLPEFPEPSAEEAAMIYGFGKGVRAIDGDEPEEEEADSKKSAKSTQSLKDPQADKKSKTPAAAAPKTPVVQMEEEDEGKDTFDASVTASDWRRNAAELEVPDNVEANPIYSYGKNFEPITFPSEKDVPPKHVRAEDEAQNASSSVEEPIAKQEEVVTAESTAEVQASSDASASWELTTEPEVELASLPTVEAASPQAFASEEEPVQAAAAEKSVVMASAVESAEVSSAIVAQPEAGSVATEQSAESVVETAKETHRPSFVARVRGWMDMMSSSSDEAAEPQAETQDQHWMTSLASPVESSKAVEPESVAPLNVSEVENPVKMAEVEELAETAAAPAVIETPAVSESQPFALENNAEPAPAEHFEVAPVDHFESFSSEPNAGDSGASTYGADQVSVSENLSDAEPVVDEVAPEEPVHEEIHAAADESSLPHLATSETSQKSGQDRWSDLLRASSEVASNGDGVVGHMPLEPMINDLHEQSATTSGESEQEPAHVAEWLRTRAAQEDIHNGNSAPIEAFHGEPALDKWNQQTIESTLDETPFADQPEPTLFETQPVQPLAEQFAERIPTLPPPNREALSGIPFLMPRTEAEPGGTGGNDSANSAAVDEVVRRVLEKLQPQLHELLSQGVKPLVENMLQNELKNEFHRNEKV